MARRLRTAGGRSRADRGGSGPWLLAQASGSENSPAGREQGPQGLVLTSRQRTLGVHFVWAQGGLGPSGLGPPAAASSRSQGRPAELDYYVSCTLMALWPRPVSSQPQVQHQQPLSSWTRRRCGWAGPQDGGFYHGLHERMADWQGRATWVKARLASLPWALGLCFRPPHRGQGCLPGCQSGHGASKQEPNGASERRRVQGNLMPPSTVLNGGRDSG